MPSFKKTSRFFTLIELLVVIAIIAILSALLLSGVTRGVEEARKAKARAFAGQVKLAIDQYFSEYQNVPVPNATADALAPSAVAVLDALKGGNNRSIVFLKEAKSSAALLQDPWGGTYQIAIDGDVDGNVYLNSSLAVVANASTATYFSSGAGAVWTKDSKQQPVGSFVK